MWFLKPSICERGSLDSRTWSRTIISVLHFHSTFICTCVLHLRVLGKVTPAFQISLTPYPWFHLFTWGTEADDFWTLVCPSLSLSSHHIEWTLGTFSRRKENMPWSIAVWREFLLFLIHACCSLWSQRNKWKISVYILDQWLFNLRYSCSGTVSSLHPMRNLLLLYGWNQVDLDSILCICVV